ncbi:hypothetical protein [Rhodococcus koreensis]|uniref:hypothetical protein n=1 Tax=Rhodococcus koreensis TaxID=99653 RepID=UPI001FC93A32|nr:hypothetical protein [Rhodococcus koreensis]
MELPQFFDTVGRKPNEGTVLGADSGETGSQRSSAGGSLGVDPGDLDRIGGVEAQFVEVSLDCGGISGHEDALGFDDYRQFRLPLGVDTSCRRLFIHGGCLSFSSSVPSVLE